MKARWTWMAAIALLALPSCGSKRPVPSTPPPPPPENIFALLPEPDGSPTAIVVRNQAGSQELNLPNQAVRVPRNDVAPGAPSVLTEPDVRRLFGAAIDSLPQPEVSFLLHFDEGRQTLNAESLATIPLILAAIRERHSTSVTVIGHTDTVDTPQFNYRLGMQRAQNVANILYGQGLSASDVTVSSHGDADLLVKTERGKDEPRNRRVEVTVR